MSRMTPLEIVDLKEAEVAVVILDAFLLQLAALLGRELVVFAAFFGTLRRGADDRRGGLAIVRPLAIGPAVHLHLEQAEVDPELQFLAAIESEDFAHLDRARFMRPIFDEPV